MLHSFRFLSRKARALGTLMSVVLVFASMPAPVRSMPLADKIPSDAILYVGWAGADALASSFQSSDLSAFVNHSNLPQIARDTLPKIWEQLSGQTNDNQAVSAMQKALPLLWRHPTAIYVASASINPDGTPAADVAMICDAGTDAAELQADLQSAITGGDHLHVIINGSMVTLGIDKSGTVAPATTLAQSPKFIASMKSLQASVAFAVYVDANAILKMAGEAAAKDSDAAVIWPKVRDALGLTDAKTFAMTGGFDGGNWMTASLLEAPTPRKGLLAVIEPKPIDPELLARIPATAGSVSVWNFDAALLFDTIAQAMTASKQADTVFHQATGLASIGLGRNLRRQILASLGPQWVFYADSASHTLVGLNHPTNADDASDGLVSAAFGLINLANSQIPGAATQPVVTADQKTTKGIDLTSAVLSFASPSFAVKKKVLYFAISPESVVTAANLPAVDEGRNLMHTADFLAAVKRLAASNMASFSYGDIPNTAGLSFERFPDEEKQLRQMLSLFDVDLPAIRMPDMDQLKAQLSPALSVGWSDENGTYCKSVSPFPGSILLLGDPQPLAVGISTASTASSFIVPLLKKARARARTVAEESSEHQICVALSMYCNDHQGMFPPDLGSCLPYLGGSGSLRNFIKPDSQKKVPTEIINGTKETQAVWINENTEFELKVANQKMTTIRNPSGVAALVPKDAEKATDHVPIGFVDGHTESCDPDRVKQLLHPEAPAQNP